MVHGSTIRSIAAAHRTPTASLPIDTVELHEAPLQQHVRPALARMSSVQAVAGKRGRLTGAVWGRKAALETLAAGGHLQILQIVEMLEAAVAIESGTEVFHHLELRAALERSAVRVA